MKKEEKRLSLELAKELREVTEKVKFKSPGDITLEDVLITSQGKLEFNRTGFEITDEMEMIIFETDDGGSDQEGEYDFNDNEYVFWKLGKSLNEQSKETLTFLHNLLCVKR